MQFTAALFLAAAAVASPLTERNGWGSCASNCQYTCTTVGLINAANCVSALNGNTITIDLLDVIAKRDAEAEAAKRCSWGGCSPSGDATCCTTDGVLNILNCVDLLNGNTISVPIGSVLGL